MNFLMRTCTDICYGGTGTGTGFTELVSSASKWFRCNGFNTEHILSTLSTVVQLLRKERDGPAQRRQGQLHARAPYRACLLIFLGTLGTRGVGPMVIIP